MLLGTSGVDILCSESDGQKIVKGKNSIVLNFYIFRSCVFGTHFICSYYIVCLNETIKMLQFWPDSNSLQKHTKEI